MSTKALVILAEGAEEMEVVITVDVLRRAGVQVSDCFADFILIFCNRMFLYHNATFRMYFQFEHFNLRTELNMVLLFDCR